MIYLHPFELETNTCFTCGEELDINTGLCSCPDGISTGVYLGVNFTLFFDGFDRPYYEIDSFVEGKEGKNNLDLNKKLAISSALVGGENVLKDLEKAAYAYAAKQLNER